ERADRRKPPTRVSREVVLPAAGHSRCSLPAPEVAPHDTSTVGNCRLPYFPDRSGKLLSPSLPDSVCDRKKTSLTSWLPLPHIQLDSPVRSFSSPGPNFTPASSPQPHHSNSK